MLEAKCTKLNIRAQETIRQEVRVAIGDEDRQEGQAEDPSGRLVYGVVCGAWLVLGRPQQQKVAKL